MKSVFTRRFLFVLVAGLFPVLRCATSTGPGAISLQTVTETETYTYSATATRLTIYTPMEISQYSSCSGSTLETGQDTSEADTSSYTYRIEGSTLNIVVDTMGASEFFPFTDPTARIEMLLAYRRTGSGSGLIGSWYYSEPGYRTIAGSLTSEEEAGLDSLFSASGDDGEDWFTSMTISASTITVEYEVEYADDFIDEWEWEYEGEYDVTVTRLSSAQVQLTGNVTGEVVMVSWNGEGDQTWQSDNGDRTVHVHYENPATCPNEEEPEWFEDFLEANSLA